MVIQTLNANTSLFYIGKHYDAIVRLSELIHRPIILVPNDEAF